MDFLKTFFLAFFILMIFYFTDVKGKSVTELEDKNQTTLQPSEVVDEGFGNVNKTDLCEPNPCENNGSCTLLEESFEQFYTNASSDGFRCLCAHGYSGRYCQTDLCSKCGKDNDCLIHLGEIICQAKANITEPKNECQNLTCVNNGFCIKLEREECICPLGFKGERCELIDKNETTCIRYFRDCEETGGYCTSDENNAFLCKCPDGKRYIRRHGCLANEVIRNCSRDMVYCEGTGGYCTTNRYQEIFCKCHGNLKYQSGYGCANVGATNCSLSLGNCEETGGYCTREKRSGIIRCNCPEESTYELTYGCRKICYDGLCQNGGTCFVERGTFKCYCKESFVGKFCETDPCDRILCSNGGICRVDKGDAKCYCKEPYGGKYCSVRMETCETNICENGGLCRLIDFRPQCFCMEPYKGKFCHILGDPPKKPANLTVICAIAVFITVIVTSIFCFACDRIDKAIKEKRKLKK